MLTSHFQKGLKRGLSVYLTMQSGFDLSNHKPSLSRKWPPFSFFDGISRHQASLVNLVDLVVGFRIIGRDGSVRGGCIGSDSIFLIRNGSLGHKLLYCQYSVELESVEGIMIMFHFLHAP
jgi:hypothetical protein